MDADQEKQLVTFKAGEADDLSFFYHEGDAAKTPIDVSTGTFNFQVKKKKSLAVVLEKEDADFDKTQAANGIVKITIQKDDTKDLEPGTYIAEIRAIFNATDSIDKCKDVDFTIVRPVHEG